MPSPFPGMDPHIEAPGLWQDFHGDLVAEIRAALNRSIRPRYVAALFLYITSKGEVPLRLYHVEIRTTAQQELVTVIEILSPVNKRPGHEAFADYGRKRRDLLRASVHLIELDLLRAGTRPPLEDPVPQAPYYALVSRANHRPWVDVWPMPLQEALPSIPIPLLEPDPDASLDLGAVVASVYERGGYADRIDYREPPPPPPLSEEEAAWVEALLREQGRRGEG